VKEKNSLYGAMQYVLNFYFGAVEDDTIETFCHNQVQDFDVENALAVLHGLNLSVTQKRIDCSNIDEHFFPSILYDENMYALVLLERDNDTVTVYEPISKALQKLDIAKLRSYENALLIFRQNRYLKDGMKASGNKTWFNEPLKSHKKSYIEVAVLTLFINIFALAVPLFAMSVYDRVVPNQAFETLFVLSIGVILVLVFDVIFKYVRTHILENVAKKLGLHWEMLLMKKMLFIKAKDDMQMTGAKANLFKELQQIRDFFAIRSITQIVDLPFFFIALLAIYLISPTVAIVPVIFAIMIVGFNLLMQKPVADLGKKDAQNAKNRYSYVVETIEGSESLKLHNATASRMFDWRSIVSVTDAIAMKIQSLNLFSLSLSQTAVQLVVVFVVIVGVYEISTQNLTVGGLIAVTILASRTMVPVVNFSSVLLKLKEVTQSVERVDAFLSLEDENEDENETGLGRLRGKIEFKNVSYGFKESKYKSVEDISFTINPTEKVGIIGQTGAGKSTIIKLLTRLHTPDSGAIYLDDHDIASLHPVELRRNIGVMTQEPFLFNATLKQNIELAKPISKERMMELIALTGLEELVKKSGKGDSLEVGERGKNLSVGQRHLVALAQSIVNDPSILVLDEPTTGLDTGLEKKLITHLKPVVKEKTLIVITHRFAALELVDRVIVLNEGKIVADGPRDVILQALSGNKNKG
jgi:ATP-binding cassette subfamily B protein/ATP-binding cassette subfamily C protein LapB